MEFVCFHKKQFIDPHLRQRGYSARDAPRSFRIGEIARSTMLSPRSNCTGDPPRGCALARVSHRFFKALMTGLARQLATDPRPHTWDTSPPPEQTAFLFPRF